MEMRDHSETKERNFFEKSEDKKKHAYQKLNEGQLINNAKKNPPPPQVLVMSNLENLKIAELHPIQYTRYSSWQADLIEELFAGCVGLDGELELGVYGRHPDVDWLWHLYYTELRHCVS